MNESITVFVCAGGLAGMSLCLWPIRRYLDGQQQKHERDHLERMKALEMGLALPAQQFAQTRATAFRIAFSIGAVVPVVAFVSSALASMAVGFHEAIWIAAGMVGLGGVICGTVVASILLSPPSAAGTDEAADSFTGYKPRVEDDAYDVVSARG